MLTYHKPTNASQKGFGGTWKPQQIKSTHVLLIHLKDSKTPSDRRFKTEHGYAFETSQKHELRIPQGVALSLC